MTSPSVAQIRLEFSIMKQQPQDGEGKGEGKERKGKERKGKKEGVST